MDIIPRFIIYVTMPIRLRKIYPRSWNIWFTFFFQILFTEALLLKNYSQKLKPFLRNSYNMVGCLLLGFTLCMLFIEIVKLYVGRLRPHFLTVCQPNISTSNCSKTFITSYTCQGSDLDAICDSR